MTVLKPCPFCGGEARLNVNNESGKRDFWKGYVNVSCGGNPCCIAGACLVCSTDFTVSEEEKQKCIEKWNTRANEQQGGE